MFFDSKIISQDRTTHNPESLLKTMVYHYEITMGNSIRGKTLQDAERKDIFEALALSLRDQIISHWSKTVKKLESGKHKQTFYFSLEFLIGRSFSQNVMNLHLTETVNAVLKPFDLNINDLENLENEAGLGNGGLGRLAACFLGSAASMGLPVHGYGLRYDYGIFNQEIRDGYQFEKPDVWLKERYPWEIENKNDAVEVVFGDGVIKAIPFDLPVIGMNNEVVNTLRLWSTSQVDPDRYDMQSFNQGDYEAAFRNISRPEITSNLYPNDNTDAGKKLRLKQEFLLVSASLQDILKNFTKLKLDIQELPNFVHIHINDTHPALVVPELIRLLVESHALSFEEALKITRQCVAYTNHTVLPEAMEKWSQDLLRSLLPQQYKMIELINFHFIESLRNSDFSDDEFLSNPINRDRLIDETSILQEGVVKMAHLAIIGSHSINGVAQIHTDILKKNILPQFYRIYKNHFRNVTNGIEHRRWLLKANPELSGLITKVIGNEKWISQFDQLKHFEKGVRDQAVLSQLQHIKRLKKQALVDYVAKHNPVRDALGNVTSPSALNIDSIFIVQAKRLHEYKRQLMTALQILMEYFRLKNDPVYAQQFVPKTYFFAAKAAPGYYRAKDIIKFINILARTLEHEDDISNKLKIVYIENYNVSVAEVLLPAADLSLQISTAGQEASGTGNMKLALNGALTVGTWDGANVEMADFIGAENMYLFGAKAAEIEKMKEAEISSIPFTLIKNDSEIEKLIQELISGEFATSEKEKEVLKNIANLLLARDEYFVLYDLKAFDEQIQLASKTYLDQNQWTTKMLLNIARMYYFSSDRSIDEYNKNDWKLRSLENIR